MSLPFFPVYLLPSLPFRRHRHRYSLPSSLTTTTTITKTPFNLVSSEMERDAPPTLASDSDPYLQGHISQLRCVRCAAALCLSSQIISKGFTGRHGRAYLVSPSALPFPVPPSHLREKSASTSPTTPTTLATPIMTAPAVPPSPLLPSRQSPRQPWPGGDDLPNTRAHTPVPRQLVTGLHTVRDVSCRGCEAVVGWKYEGAEEEAQQYKVGKFILEAKRVCAQSGWEFGLEEEGGPGSGLGPGQGLPVGDGWLGGDRWGGGEEVEFDSQDEEECEDLFAGVWSPALAGMRREGRRFGR